MASNLRVDTILPSTGLTLGIGTASGTINFLGNSNLTTTGDVTVGGNLGVGGTLTYEDVTNIDSVGLITARSGLRVSGGEISLGTGTPRQKLHINASDSGAANMVFTNTTTGTSAGDGFVVGITGGEDAQLNMQESANLKFSTADTERLRIGSAGQIGIAGANYGTSGQVLTSQGASSAVQWSSPSSGLAMADHWRLTVGQTITTTDVVLTSWARPNTSGTGGGAYVGGGMSNSSGTFSFPTTGIYLITFQASFNGTNNTRYSEIDIVVTKNNSTYVEAARSFFYFNRPTGTSTGASSSCSFIMDVDNISNDKVRFESSQDNVGQHQVLGDTGNATVTTVTFLRLGDT